MAATHTLPLASPGMARICLYGDLQRFGRRIDLRVKTGAEAIDGTKDITLTPKDLDAYSKSEVQSALAGKQPLDNTLTNLSGKDVAGLLAYLQLGEAAKRDVGTGNNQLPDMSAFGMSRNGQTAWDILPNGMIRQVGTVTLTPVGNFNAITLGGVLYYTHYYR
ncbi:TPA: hypothetical protein OC077_004836, partial [Escherichia coli]|nr:hypothetical protein [Escherichia coli]HCP2057834.1 hypothetical protein [Escherichia coli]